eukprot:450200-Prymnesium_polylepis.1
MGRGKGGTGERNNLSDVVTYAYGRYEDTHEPTAGEEPGERTKPSPSCEPVRVQRLLASVHAVGWRPRHRPSSS